MTAPAAATARARWPRLVALVLAILLGVAGWFVWQNADSRSAARPLSADQLPGLGMPAEVANCIDKREAEINALLDEGLMEAHAAELSLQRARSFCVQQN
ncbi:hypothetical protein [Nitratireductor thuwali]|uniref:DUF732 domain-containing protein n=1 Tax=Nitratireductor thuwali TaxID=2267699 RepID=A0ABY5MG20_9HYPH|nr:hypothetical protein NTH_00140 [Nitratireductor thuwali]